LGSYEVISKKPFNEQNYAVLLFQLYRLHPSIILIDCDLDIGDTNEIR